ncbi:hypothetical protein [Mycobacterium sp. NAZ190054]|uniref:hypothetical protein n=1 Tax=Mycobacterium sp. NAZ190054 TaxID=1747766 RepID=UPI000B1808C5|nr:hypothetical protein [Mycobacterium sp. NAZ190054]
MTSAPHSSAHWGHSVQDGTDSGDNAATRTVDAAANLPALKALLRISEAVSRANYFDEVLEVIAEQAMAALGAASLSIRRREPDREALRTLIQVGDPTPAMQGELAAPVMVGDSLWGEIWATGAAAAASATARPSCCRRSPRTPRSRSAARSC